ncbi:MAG: phosphotransferase [Pseudomonadota bacterium]
MARGREFLPETPEELTPEWLSTALARPITDIETQNLGEGVGFMGDVLLTRFSPAGQQPASAVIKLPKKANRVMGEMLGVYEREIMFFREFGADVPVRVPRLYFSAFDRDKGSENQKAILEQIDRWPLFLSKAVNVVGAAIAGAKKRRYLLGIEFLEGMQPGDQLAGLSPERCGIVLEDIAKLHRAYTGSAALDEQFWLLPLGIDARLRHGIFLQHVDRFARSAPPGLAPKLAWLRDNGVELSHRLMAEAPNTLLHGDLRLDNVVFDGEHCAFIDWQLVRHGPAAYDVAYFLSSALRQDASGRDTDDLLARYYDALAIADYSFAAFRRDYDRALLTIVANMAGANQVDVGDGRGRRLMQAWFERLDARLADVQLDSLLATG